MRPKPNYLLLGGYSIFEKMADDRDKDNFQTTNFCSELNWLVAEEDFNQTYRFVYKEENLLHICKPFAHHEPIRLALYTCLKTATAKEK
jgi:hypothetical protein